MTKVKDIIEKGQDVPDEVVHYRIPGDASPLTLCGLDVWADDTSVTERAGSSNCPACREAADEDAPRRAEPEPLNVTALISDSREIMLLLGVTEAADVLPELTRRLGAPEPQQADVSPLLDLVRQYGHACHENGRLKGKPGEAEAFADVQTLFDRIAALVPQQPEVPPGTKTGSRVHLATIKLAELRGLLNKPLLDLEPGVAMRTLREAQELLFAELKAPVVMRALRTWPRLDSDFDVKGFTGKSGTRYVRSALTEAYAAFIAAHNVGAERELLLSATRSHWQEIDGPLTEVFEDEPGGEPR